MRLLLALLTFAFHYGTFASHSSDSDSNSDEYDYTNPKNFIIPQGFTFGKHLLTKEVIAMLGAAQAHLVNPKFETGMENHPYVIFVRDSFKSSMRKVKFILDCIWKNTIWDLVDKFYFTSEKNSSSIAVEKILTLMGCTLKNEENKGQRIFAKNNGIHDIFELLKIADYSPQVFTYFLYLLAGYEQTKAFGIATLKENFTYFIVIPDERINMKSLPMPNILYLTYVEDTLLKRDVKLPKKLAKDPFTLFLQGLFIQFKNLDKNKIWKQIARKLLFDLFNESDLGESLPFFVQQCGYYYISQYEKDYSKNVFTSFGLSQGGGFRQICFLIFEYRRIRRGEFGPALLDVLTTHFPDSDDQMQVPKNPALERPLPPITPIPQPSLIGNPGNLNTILTHPMLNYPQPAHLANTFPHGNSSGIPISKIPHPPLNNPNPEISNYFPLLPYQPQHNGSQAQSNLICPPHFNGIPVSPFPLSYPVNQTIPILPKQLPSVNLGNHVYKHHEIPTPHNQQNENTSLQTSPFASNNVNNCIIPPGNPLFVPTDTITKVHSLELPQVPIEKKTHEKVTYEKSALKSPPKRQNPPPIKRKNDKKASSTKSNTHSTLKTLKRKNSKASRKSRKCRRVLTGNEEFDSEDGEFQDSPDNDLPGDHEFDEDAY
jgi:hypothetical protein